MPFGPLIRETLQSLTDAAQLLAISVALFTAIVFIAKGREMVALGKRAIAEVRLNLSWYFLDAVFVAPVVALAVAAIRLAVSAYSLQVVSEHVWEGAGRLFAFVAVIFVGDFISYWRHLLEHTRWLWPAHAIHHSDTEMTFLTLARFHPVNRVVTSCVDFGLLALLGFPAWALIANAMVRNYYGQLIHVELPWMYGPLRWIFVSPVMHQWHHSVDYIGSGSNFATVFSVFDRAFGTYHVPGPCTGPLGVGDDVGGSIVKQMIYPLVCWRDALRPGGRETQTDPST